MLVPVSVYAMSYELYAMCMSYVALSPLVYEKCPSRKPSCAVRVQLQDARWMVHNFPLPQGDAPNM